MAPPLLLSLVRLQAAAKDWAAKSELYRDLSLTKKTKCWKVGGETLVSRACQGSDGI